MDNDRDENNSVLQRNMRNAINMSELSDNELIKQSSDRIKLSYTTTIIKKLNFLAILLPILLVITLAYFHAVSTIFNNFPSIATLVTVMFLFIYKNFNEYYVLDKKRKAIMLKRKFFSINTYKYFAHFNTIDAVVANGLWIRATNRKPSYWTYRAEIVLRTGKVIPIDDWSREDFIKADISAKHFADMANIQFVQGKNMFLAKPRKINNKYSFVIVKRIPLSKLKKTLYYVIIPALLGLLMAYLRYKLRLVDVVGE